MVSLINPTAIPPITALRQELDYGDPQLSRCQAFYDSVRVFRKTFVSSQGWEGSSLHDWRSRDHQIALGEMVRAYLELHGNGRLFWPDDNSQSRANKLKYSTDSARIKRIMRQLFWRLNIQQHRNIKYKKNRDRSGEVEAPSGRGLSHDNRTDLHVVDDASASRDVAEWPGTPSTSTVRNTPASPVAVNTSVINAASIEASSNNSNKRERSEDVYRVPDSPDLRIVSPPHQTTSTTTSTDVGDDRRQVAPYANMEPSPKRLRGDDKLSARPMASKWGPKIPASLRTSRVSPRKRKIRQVPGCATAEEVSAAFQSLERSPISETAECPAPTGVNDIAASHRLASRPHRSTHSLRADVVNMEDEENANSFADEANLQLSTETELRATEPRKSTTEVGSPAREPPAEAAPEPSMVKTATKPSSPKPSTSSSVPAEGREAVDETSLKNADAPQAPPTGQARVDFLYRVVCHYPQRQSFHWKPEGSFRDKTLAKLEEELSAHLKWSEFQYLHFRLDAPNTRAEQLVCRGREDQFDTLKRHLAGFIRGCIADTPCDRTLLVAIDIEPLLDVNSVGKSTDSQVMDFEW